MALQQDFTQGLGFAIEKAWEFLCLPNVEPEEAQQTKALLSLIPDNDKILVGLAEVIADGSVTEAKEQWSMFQKGFNVKFPKLTVSDVLDLFIKNIGRINFEVNFIYSCIKDKKYEEAHTRIDKLLPFLKQVMHFCFVFNNLPQVVESDPKIKLNFLCLQIEAILNYCKMLCALAVCNEDKYCEFQQDFELFIKIATQNAGNDLLFINLNLYGEFCERRKKYQFYINQMNLIFFFALYERGQIALTKENREKLCKFFETYFASADYLWPEKASAIKQNAFLEAKKRLKKDETFFSELFPDGVESFRSVYSARESKMILDSGDEAYLTPEAAQKVKEMMHKKPKVIARMVKEDWNFLSRFLRTLYINGLRGNQVDIRNLIANYYDKDLIKHLLHFPTDGNSLFICDALLGYVRFIYFISLKLDPKKDYVEVQQYFSKSRELIQKIFDYNKAVCHKSAQETSWFSGIMLVTYELVDSLRSRAELFQPNKKVELKKPKKPLVLAPQPQPSEEEMAEREKLQKEKELKRAVDSIQKIESDFEALIARAKEIYSDGRKSEYSISEIDRIKGVIEGCYKIFENLEETKKKLGSEFLMQVGVAELSYNFCILRLINIYIAIVEKFNRKSKRQCDLHLYDKQIITSLDFITQNIFLAVKNKNSQCDVLASFQEVIELLMTQGVHDGASLARLKEIWLILLTPGLVKNTQYQIESAIKAINHICNDGKFIVNKLLLRGFLQFVIVNAKVVAITAEAQRLLEKENRSKTKKAKSTSKTSPPKHSFVALNKRKPRSCRDATSCVSAVTETDVAVDSVPEESKDVSLQSSDASRTVSEAINTVQTFFRAPSPEAVLFLKIREFAGLLYKSFDEKEVDIFLIGGAARSVSSSKEENFAIFSQSFLERFPAGIVDVDYRIIVKVKEDIPVINKILESMGFRYNPKAKSFHSDFVEGLGYRADISVKTADEQPDHLWNISNHKILIDRSQNFGDTSLQLEWFETDCSLIDIEPKEFLRLFRLAYLGNKNITSVLEKMKMQNISANTMLMKLHFNPFCSELDKTFGRGYGHEMFEAFLGFGKNENLNKIAQECFAFYFGVLGIDFKILEQETQICDFMGKAFGEVDKMPTEQSQAKTGKIMAIFIFVAYIKHLRDDTEKCDEGTFVKNFLYNLPQLKFEGTSDSLGSSELKDILAIFITDHLKALMAQKICLGKVPV